MRWLIDTEPPGAQRNGLRHFQRMVGFRYGRVRLRRYSGTRTLAAVVPAYVAMAPWLEGASSFVRH